MKKRYKTDYLGKLCILSKICRDNISYAHKIMTSQQVESDYTIHTGKEIMKEVALNLEKDYFAPFEREDIFMLCETLNELSKTTYFLCMNLSDNNFFNFPGNMTTLAESLLKASESIQDIFINLSKSQKKTDLNTYISKAENNQEELTKLTYKYHMTLKTEYFGTFHIMEKCADSTDKIIQLIQYTLFKNS